MRFTRRGPSTVQEHFRTDRTIRSRSAQEVAQRTIHQPGRLHQLAEHQKGADRVVKRIMKAETRTKGVEFGAEAEIPD